MPTDITSIIATSKLSGGLYIVATPIGNMKDITLRALEVLQSADLILCEDTRVTQKLIRYFGFNTPTSVYNDHSTPKARTRIMQLLQQGQAIALVSDAGTPLISDPGYKLVREATEQQIPVTSLPGASSVLTALSLSGLPTDRFIFEGFLPPKQGARKTILKELSSIQATSIYFTRGSKLLTILKEMREAFGERDIAIARELTKRFEEVKRGTTSHLIEYYESCENPPKGEIVIVVSPPGDESCYSPEDIDRFLQEQLQDMKPKELAALAAEQFSQPKKSMYDRILALKK